MLVAPKTVRTQINLLSSLFDIGKPLYINAKPRAVASLGT
jgi:hypothetical protein